MRAVRRRLAEGRDSGFTLIELLTVILIISVLAGLAVAIFLDQRKKSYDAAAKSDMRNLATFEEIYLNDYGTYTSIAQVVLDEPAVFSSQRVTLSVVWYAGAEGYCLSATHLGSARTWFYDSRAGGLQPEGSTGCPVTNSGTPGGSLTG